MSRGISLTGAAQGRWLLQDGDHRLEVESSPRGKTRRVRLYVDDRQVAEKETKLKWVTFDVADLTETGGFGSFGEDAKIRATWDWLGDLSRVAVHVPAEDEDQDQEDAGDGDAAAKVSLVKAETAEAEEESTDKDDKDDKDFLKKSEELPFAPPEGTRAFRREKFVRKHPKLYAARHVMLAAGKVIWPLLGIGLLIQIPWPDIPFPDISIPTPDIDLPSIPWPDIDLPDIPWPDITLPGWVKAILGTAKYWGPILIAIGVASNEHERRKKQRAKVAEMAAKKSTEAEAAGEPRTGTGPADDPEPAPDENDRVSR